MPEPTLGDLLTRVTALGADRPAITLDDDTLTSASSTGPPTAWRRP